MRRGTLFQLTGSMDRECEEMDTR